MHYNCLIIDDETELARMTCEYFLMFDVSCTYVETAAACESFLAVNEVDVILLDINLQGESGFSICKKLRETSDIPILFISARQSDDDILIALNIGGDDYIKKPYSLSVLLAKVKVILKRQTKRVSGLPVAASDETDKANVSAMPEGCSAVDRLILDENTLRAVIDGRTVQLKAKEFRLLACLYDNRGTIVTKEQLFNKVWGDTFFSDGTLNVHIRRLREKLERNPNEPELIKTIWGTGYILEV